MSSLALRSLIAVGLMIGFYALALGIVGGLLYLPYAEVVYAERLHIKLALGCVVGAVAILWSILPRVDRFEAPGPRITRDDAPLLFDRLEAVAERARQSMPREVYLVADFNAWVASRGGVMGFGSRRIMGIGLPVLQVLSKAELEAVLAHEFGHYSGGDTKLGPWVYKTRNAIGRTLGSLGNQGVLHVPFEAYGKVFLRITHGISRAQELAADRLSASICGKDSLVEGLRKVHAHARAFGVYWEQDYAPLLFAGLRAPLLDGYATFCEAPAVRTAIDQAFDRPVDEAPADPLDTHPPLHARIAAVEDLSSSTPPDELDQEPAIALLVDPAAAEERLMASLVRDQALRAVAWEEVLDRFYLPAWRAQVHGLPEPLRVSTFDALPATIQSFGPSICQSRIRSESHVDLPRAVEAELLSGIVWPALLVQLVDRRWRPTVRPGYPVLVEREGRILEPSKVIREAMGQMLEGSATPAWSALLEETGIAASLLGDVPTEGEGATLVPAPRIDAEASKRRYREMSLSELLEAWEEAMPDAERAVLGDELEARSYRVASLPDPPPSTRAGAGEAVS